MESANTKQILLSLCIVFGIAYIIKSRRNYISQKNSSSSKGKRSVKEIEKKSEKSESDVKHVRISEDGGSSGSVDGRSSFFTTWLTRSFSVSPPRAALSTLAHADAHPEGPNIGYESHESWTQAAKVDLLHKGLKHGGKLVVVLVGLPGTGKTYIARKIARYLRWISYRTRAFSLAKQRLESLGPRPAQFFDPADAQAAALRRAVQAQVLSRALDWLGGGGEIAILDGTHCSAERRALVRAKVEAVGQGYDILWVESKLSLATESQENSQENSKRKMADSPDYSTHEDFLARRELYSREYTSVSASEGGCVLLTDSCMSVSGCRGFLGAKIACFLMNLGAAPRPVYLVRHGESVFNQRGLIGGDSGLSENGFEFSRALNDYLHKQELSPEDSARLVVWSSPMMRAQQTAAEIKCARKVEWRALREMDAGLTYEQVEAKFPEEFRARQSDKLNYRYPRGESYLDVIARLEPVIFELERGGEPLLIVAHQAVLRCLYAYFLDLPIDEIPYLSLPLHSLVRLETSAYKCREKRVRIVVGGGQAGD